MKKPLSGNLLIQLKMKNEKRIDLIFNLLVLVLAVCAAIQYAYTEHPYMAGIAAIIAFLLLGVITIRYGKE